MQVITWIIIIGICCCCLVGIIWVAMKIDATRRVSGSASDSAAMLLNSFASRQVAAAPPLPIQNVEWIAEYRRQAEAVGQAVPEEVKKNVQDYIQKQQARLAGTAKKSKRWKWRPWGKKRGAYSDSEEADGHEEAPLFDDASRRERAALTELQRIV